MGLRQPLHQLDREPHLFLSIRTHEQILWCELYRSIRERLFPPNLPPLELTSTPVAVPDRMAANTNPWAIGTSAAVNGVIALLAILLGVKVVNHSPPFATPVDKFVIKDFPLFTPMRSRGAGGGSGGGTNDPVEANMGHNPKQDLHPLAPAQMPVLDNPRLAVDNSIVAPPDIKLPDNPAMALIGVHSSANVTLASGGRGGPSGIGSGDGGGDGPGHGQNGWGPGSQATYVPGRDGVTQPIPIYTPEAEFSDEARRQKHQGACMISVVIDAQGNPQNPRVVQPIGFGLDQKALEAVRHYRFKPARKNGRPVAVRIAVMVNFKLY